MYAAWRCCGKCGEAMSEAFVPFDPEDSGDIAGEMFRRQVVQLVLDADKVTVYRELDQVKKLEVFMAGALTGIICACFGSIRDEGRDAIMEHVARCLPAARRQAEGLRIDDALVSPAERGCE